jgi:Tfp pilus assembly protein PilF
MGFFGRMKTSSLAVIASLAVSLSATVASAQAGLTLPEVSPAASVSQTVGLTEIKIDYHRPAVNGRKIWGGLVPYGEVWRAGANENTTITFSSPVKIEGKSLAAGSYGLHMIPTDKDWTVVFSKMSVAWGSFSYDEKEDALRIKVTPVVLPASQERLGYTFDNPTMGSVTIAMRWEKVEVPIKLEVDTPAVTMAHMRDELRGLPRFGWQGWNQAARYWLQNGGDLAEADAMVTRSMGMQETYQNVTTKAMILEKKGDQKNGAAMRTKALGLAGEADINQRGYELVAEKKMDEAITMFQKNVKDHPASWNAHDSLAEAYATKGDKKNAIASYTKALSLVKDDANKKRIEATLARLKAAK